MLSFMFWGYFILYSNDFVIFFLMSKLFCLERGLQNGSAGRSQGSLPPMDTTNLQQYFGISLPRRHMKTDKQTLHSKG